MLLALGVRFDDRTSSSWLPGYSFTIPPTKLIHVDIDPDEIGRNYPVALGLMADVRTFLRQVLGELDGRKDVDARAAARRKWLDTIDGYRKEWDAFIAPGFIDDATPINPQRAAHEIDKALPDDAIMVSDIGVHHNWLMQFCKPRRPDSLIGSMGFGPMGFGVAGVLGRKACGARPALRLGVRRRRLLHARERARHRGRIQHPRGLGGVEQLRLRVDPRAAARLSRRPRARDRLPPSRHRPALQSRLRRDGALGRRRGRARRPRRRSRRRRAQGHRDRQALPDRRSRSAPTTTPAAPASGNCPASARASPPSAAATPRFEMPLSAYRDTNVLLSDLILRSRRSRRLEGWPHAAACWAILRDGAFAPPNTKVRFGAMAMDRAPVNAGGQLRMRSPRIRYDNQPGRLQPPHMGGSHDHATAGIEKLQAARARPLGRLGRRQHRRDPQGLRLCRRGRRCELQRAGGLHRPRRARPAQSEEGRRVPRAARRALPQAARRRRRPPLRQLGAARRRQRASNARAGLFIFDISKPDEPKRGRLLRHARQRAAPLRRRQQAQARVPAERRAGLEQARDLDARHQRSAQARGRQHLGPAVDEDGGRRRGQRSDAARKARSRCTARR